MSDLQIKSIIERILRLHAESDELAADIREVYAEAKANGFDKTALGAAVRAIRQRDKVGEAAIAERETIVGLYLAAYDGPSHVHASAPAREATYPERVSRPAPVDQPAPPSPARDPQSGFKGSDPEGAAGGESPSPIAASEQVSVVVPQARNEPGSEVVASGGGGVTASPETRPAFTLPLAKPLRPHCQSPDRCGSYGSKHCDACIRAAGLTEALAYG